MRAKAEDAELKWQGRTRADNRPKSACRIEGTVDGQKERSKGRWIVAAEYARALLTGLEDGPRGRPEDAPQLASDLVPAHSPRG